MAFVSESFVGIDSSLKVSLATADKPLLNESVWNEMTEEWEDKAWVSIIILAD